MTKDSLGDRMVAYQDISRTFLTKRVPVVVRLDGKAFHSFTKKNYGKGFSEDFTKRMVDTAIYVQKNIQGCLLSYVQSDEISLLLTDYSTISTQGWFDYNRDKIISISASLATAIFNKTTVDIKFGLFDSRAFNIPQDEVCNYFIWRQQDAIRNAIQMAGQEKFSPKQLHGWTCADIISNLESKFGIRFNSLPINRQRGTTIINGLIDNECPVFSNDRKYIEQFVYIRKD